MNVNVILKSQIHGNELSIKNQPCPAEAARNIVKKKKNVKSRYTELCNAVCFGGVCYWCMKQDSIEMILSFDMSSEEFAGAWKNNEILMEVFEDDIRSFLYHQVRLLVGVLKAVGTGDITIADGELLFYGFVLLLLIINFLDVLILFEMD
ncbi:hypothetical protein F8388_005256 [Cannabis sativa]|uniref:Pseudouridine synthase I TruA alpha/beta domain-containing protein n=1 Tax=Cannabis sativa TaxID=3483 RepID=A0A7J6EL22_CANSA|nr:hypothetical protein F8388_005254 [Cannabis sativa]KAF4359147.1 hypothetical protein F8388_005256 [Cannabis sativa]